ncbi:MAG: hypothetical protein ACTSWG_10255 [Candidatus Helarchaeota archaeon]
MGRKKLIIRHGYENKICYICKKKIGSKPAWAIGKDKNDVELYRHKKCKPWEKK